MTNRSVPSVLNVLVGVWVMLSPFVLGFADSPAALWNALVVGAAVVVLAAIRAAGRGTAVLSMIVLALGVWMFFSPYFLGFSRLYVPNVNSMLAGSAIGILAFFSAMLQREPQGRGVVFASAEPDEEERRRR